MRGRGFVSNYTTAGVRQCIWNIEGNKTDITQQRTDRTDKTFKKMEIIRTIDGYNY